MGHEQILGPNEIQRMSARTGVMHSEYNGSKSDPVHFFQIWIEPATNGVQPSYEQVRFDPKRNKLKRLEGPACGNGATRINQDAQAFVADLSKGAKISNGLGDDRAAWLHAVRGEIDVNDVSLKAGDAASVIGENLELTGTGAESNEILLFDLS